MRKLWIKNREVVIVIASLCVLMVIGLMLAEVIINRYPFICLTVCAALLFFLARNKKFI